MSLHIQPHRTLLTALVALALTAPTAIAEPRDLRYEMQTSSLAGTHADTPADVNPAPTQEQNYSPAAVPATDSVDGDGISPPVVLLITIAALTVGILTGARVQARRHRAALP